MEAQIQALVEDIHSVLSATPPIDPFFIAAEEDIEIAQISNSKNFHGRIEFLRDVGKFVIYCPENQTCFPNPAIRFSVAHELGHYFIEDHRKDLLNGRSHNSRPCFMHSNPQEKEADEFAGRLLIPDNVILPHIKSRGYLSLDQIKQIANQCSTSLTATGIRYVKIASQPSAILISEDGWKRIYWPSPETAALGFGGLGKDYVPPNSITAKAAKTHVPEEGCANTAMWFSTRYAYAEIWEEACPLGNTGMTLTLLSFTIKKKGEGEWDGF